jgi:hypothetical protein
MEVLIMLNATISGYVGNMTLSQVQTDEGLKDVCNFGVCSNAHINGQDVATWVQMAVWGPRAKAMMAHKPSYITASGELFTEQFERKTDGTTGFALKMNRPNVEWGPKTTTEAPVATPATADIGSIAAAVAQVLQAQASVPAPATPAAEAPVEINFDEDPFA